MRIILPKVIPLSASAPDALSQPLSKPFDVAEKGALTTSATMDTANNTPIFIPPLHTLDSLKTRPEPGEKHLLTALYAVLKDLPNGKEYYVFFQSNLNGNSSDIIIMRKNGGVLIIEVKDWRLSHYTVKNGDWFFQDANQRQHQKKSPYRQVEYYKERIYALYASTLFAASCKNEKVYGIIKTAVYFHNIPRAALNAARIQDPYVFTLAADETDAAMLRRLLDKAYVSKQSYYFDETHYEDLLRLLLPSRSALTQKLSIKPTARQMPFCKSRSGFCKIKGPAGSGKTFVLALRAVDALRRCGNVAVICYNLTVVNYLRDVINCFCEHGQINHFVINTYHEFISDALNEVGIPHMHDPTAGFSSYEHAVYKNYAFFQHHLVDVPYKRYNTLLIDEGQDFDSVYFHILKDFFLIPDGEFVIFADEKQNVYHRDLENQMPKTPIAGRWNKLEDHSFRLSKFTLPLINAFSDTFFQQKYAHAVITSPEGYQLSFDEIDRLQYAFTPAITPDGVMALLAKALRSQNFNDICVISNVKSVLVALYNHITPVDEALRIEKTFLATPQELAAVTRKAQHFCSVRGMNNSKIDSSLYKNITRYFESVYEKSLKKFAFQLGSGHMKMSTIHSFKGWEIETVVLILDQNGLLEDELVYTALTRAKNQMLIISNATRYDAFFKAFIAKKL